MHKAWLKRRRSRQFGPAFFWQGAFILLPVAVLSALCLLALHQDKQAAETEARNRAAASAQSLGRALRASVDEELHRWLTLQNAWLLGLRRAGQPAVREDFPDGNLQADIEKWQRDYPGLRFAELALPKGAVLADGRQLEPPDFPAAPQPPPWFRDLTPEQNQLWAAMRVGGTRAQMETWRQAFLDRQPSAEAQQAVMDLFQSPDQLIGHSNFVPTETGISFEEIACYRLLTTPQAQLSEALLQAVWWHALGHASLISPKLLELAGGLTNQANPGLQRKYFWMRKFFDGQSRTAEGLASLRSLPELQLGKTTWGSHWTPDHAELAVFQPTTYVNPGNDSAGRSLAGRGYEVWLVPRAVVEVMFNRALAENQFLVPDYATAAITVEGLRLPRPAAPAALAEPVLLGQVEQKAGNDLAQAAVRFDIKLFLTNPAQMLAAEQRRAKLFGTLVLAAALTALAGLLSAQRAFRRQWQLNDQKSNFVSSVSHELRAPIASVRLMAENLERGRISEPARQRDYFRFIVQECRRLSALIENVLDFSRIEQGRKQYEFEPTNLQALAASTVQLMEPYAAEKGVGLEFRAEFGTANPELLLDGRALQQALINLIDNAVKHSRKGETVRVGLQMESEQPAIKNADRPDTGAPLLQGAWPRNQDGAMVKLYVADRGPGIPAAEQEKIFERFYRLGSELRRETQGVGIGLSVVKHIVDAHGGRVRVQSVIGQGSRFTIELPVPSATLSDNAPHDK